MRQKMKSFLAVFLALSIATAGVPTAGDAADLSTEVESEWISEDETAENMPQTKEAATDTSNNFSESPTDTSIEFSESPTDTSIEFSESTTDTSTEFSESSTDTSTEFPESTTDTSTEPSEFSFDASTEFSEITPDISSQIPESLLETSSEALTEKSIETTPEISSEKTTESEDTAETDTIDTVITWEYPDMGSTEYCLPVKVWRQDKGFDGKTDFPQWIYDSSVSGVEWISGAIDFNLEEGSRFDVLYRVVLLENPDYFWYVNVPYILTDTRDEAECRSLDFDKIVIREQSDAFEGIVPLYSGQEVEGKAYTVKKGDESFDLYGLTLGYDIAKYSVSPINPENFSIDTEGTYEIFFQVRSYAYSNMAWTARSNITVECPDSESIGMRVSLASPSLKATIQNGDGTAGKAAYGEDYVTEKRISSIEVTFSLTQEFGDCEIEPELTVQKNGTVCDREEIISEIIALDDAYTFLVREDFETGNYVLTIKDEAKSYKSSFTPVNGDAFQGIESENSPKLRSAARTSDSITFGNSGNITCDEGTHNNGGPYNGSAYRGGTVKFSDALVTEIKSYIKELGAEVTSPIPTSVHVSCISGHSYYGWPYSAMAGRIVVSAYVNRNAEGRIASVNLVVTAYPSDGSCQIFQGYANLPVTEQPAKIRLAKRIHCTDEFAALATTERICVDTTFGIYRTADCSGELVASLALQNNSLLSIATAEVPAGTYYVKEVRRNQGCALNDKIYGPYTLKAGETQTIDEIAGDLRGIYNDPYYFVGKLLDKVDKKTNQPLSGAVFRVEYWTRSKSYGGTKRATYYFKTDSKGEIRYDSAHLLTTWNGKQSSSLVEYRNGVLGLPVGFVYMTEVEAPDGYELNNSTYSMILQPVGDLTAYRQNFSSVIVPDTQQGSAKLRFKKNGTPLAADWYDLPFYTTEGAEITVYSDKNCTDMIGIAETGEMNSDNSSYTPWIHVDLGSADSTTVYYKETVRSKGHVLDGSLNKNSEVKSITLTKDDVDTGKTAALTNDVIYGVFNIHKTNGKTSNLAGAEFTIRYWTNVDRTGTPVYTWVFPTKADGTLDFAGQISKSPTWLYQGEYIFPVGYYTYEETKAPDGYRIPEDGPVRFAIISGDGSVQRKNLGVFNVVNEGEGEVYVQKTSANSKLTTGNGMYSFEGAVFGVYTGKNGSGTKAATLTSDAGGRTQSVKLEEGTYYIREESAPKGYRLSKEEREITLLAGETKAVTFPDVPKSYTPKILLQKTAPAGSTMSLANGEFTLKYYSSESAVGVPARTWVLKTDEEGRVKFQQAYLVSGDAFYQDETGTPAIPLGTLTVQETKAPQGYTIDDKIRIYHIAEDGVTGGPDGAIPPDGISVLNTPKYGGVMFQKESKDLGAVPDGDTSFAGAVFALINANDYWVTRKDQPGKTYAPGEETARITTDAFGMAKLEPVLQAGTYIIKEVTPPVGYELSSQTLSFSIMEDGVILDLTVSPIRDQVILGGFHFRKADKDSLRTTPSGNADFQGAQFAVINRSKNSVKVCEKIYEPGQTVLNITADANGYVNTGKILPYGTYGLVETKAPLGYLVNSQEAVIEIRSDQDVEITDTEGRHVWVEPVIKGGFTLRKMDKETEGGMPQGNASLAGAEFTVTNESIHSVFVNGKEYMPGAVIMTLVTDGDGFAETGKRTLPYGTYSVKETKAPKGYCIDETVKTVVISRDGQYEEEGYTKEPYPYLEQIYRGGFRFEKWDLEWNMAQRTQGDAVLEGGIYELRNCSENSVLVDGTKYGPNEVIATFTTDENGHFETKNDYLPYGTYSITELQPPKGYTAFGENLTRIFTIQEDKEWKDFTGEDSAAKNRVIRFDITLIKLRDTLSSEDPTDDVVPIPGVQFEIRLKSTQELVTVITTDENGLATTVDEEHYPDGRLPYGTYVVHEVESTVPDGLSPVKNFEVSGTIDGKNYTGIYKNDKPIEMPITIVKKDKETGNVIPKAGAEFQVLDASGQVITFTNHYPHTEELTNFVTDDSGTITLPSKLPYGTYYLHEVMAPDGYLLGEDVLFRVTSFGSWNEPLEVTFEDEEEKGKIRVTKYDEDTKEKLSGAVFAVFAADDIFRQDLTQVHRKGELVDTLTVEKDGTGTTGELYLGAYYVQEIQAPAGYCLNTERFICTLTYEEQTVPIVYADLEVKNKPTTLKLYKKDTDDQPLDGVVFQIKRVEDMDNSDIEHPKDQENDGNASEEDNPELPGEQNKKDSTESGLTETENPRNLGNADVTYEKKMVTENGGQITAGYFRPGVYSIEEIETLPGYVLDETVRFVTVDENGFIFESDSKGTPLNETKAKSDTAVLYWENDYTKWDFSKTDVTGEEELIGADMEIYDREGNLVCSWTSDGSIHRIDKLPIGSYTLVEKTAPAGYVLANAVSFEVTNTGKIQKVEMRDDHIKVEISKQDATTGKELPGAELTLKNSDGEVIASWTSSDKPYYIEYLPAGEYTLHEDLAPVGYQTANDVTFTVLETGELQKVVMKDEVLPEIPEETEAPTEPETPEETETPTESETPLETEISTEPETSEETEIPTEPETPEETETPTEPEIPKETEIPTEPETSQESEAPTEPETPEETETSTESETSSETEFPMESETPSGPKTSAAPKTGDVENILAEMLLTLLSGAILAFLVWKRGKKKAKE